MDKEKLESLVQSEVHLPTKIKRGKLPKMERPTPASKVIPGINPKYAHIGID